MARMYPQSLDRETRSQGERTLFEAFRDQLSDDYTVFHSVRWLLRDTHDGARDGEADFVLAHPQKGILVVEVKGGQIRYDGQMGQWFSGENEIKDPFKQAENNKYSLLRKLKEAPYWRDRRVIIGQGVAFPDGWVRGDLRLDAPREIVLDAQDLLGLSNWVTRAFAYYSGDSSLVAPDRAGLRALVELLSPSREIPRPLSVAIDAEAREIVRLTESQYRLLDYLSRQRRVAISGCAGSGKTTLAIEQARRLGTQGFRVLLTCFNIHMAEYFRRQQLPPSVSVESFYRLCEQMARTAGLSTKAPPGETSQQYYAELPEVLLAAIDKLGPQYDAVVVDEGQDFDPVVWVPLQSLLTDPALGILYVFYDDNQMLYRSASAIPSELNQPDFPLSENLRNTHCIHRAFLPFYRSGRTPTAIGPEGRRPEVAYYHTEARLKLLLRQALHRLLVEERIPHQNITILTPRNVAKSILSQWEYVGNTRFASSGHPGPGEVALSSIYKFKGLESPIVIVVEIRPSTKQDLDTLLYVACSRACNHLILLLEDSLTPEVRARLPEAYWPNTV
ncbi:MAG: NERD domain-containing protein [Anaerolineae bacterium]